MQKINTVGTTDDGVRGVGEPGGGDLLAAAAGRGR